MKLRDISDWEKQDAILDKEGNVLCPCCRKNLARVNRYGMIRKCKECQKTKKTKNETFGYAFVDTNGFKSR